VTARISHVRRIGETTDPELAGAEVPATEPPLQAGDPSADSVIDLEQVHDRVVGHREGPPYAGRCQRLPKVYRVGAAELALAHSSFARPGRHDDDEPRLCRQRW